MANTFFPLPVSAGVGPGVAVDVSVLGAEKSVVVEGSGSGGVIAIEGSHDGTDFAPLVTVDLLRDPGSIIFHAVVSHLRVNRISGVGPIAVSVGAQDSTNLFAAFVVPTTPGVGPALNTSALGADKTIIVSGAYFEALSVEGSNDAGVSYDPVVDFTTRNSDSAAVIGAYERMRVRRVAGGTAPVVTVGGGPLGGTGTGSQGAQGFQGAQGVQGVQGVQGDIGGGAQGAQGSLGTQGSQGNQGFQGFQGFQGLAEEVDETLRNGDGGTTPLGTVVQVNPPDNTFYQAESGLLVRSISTVGVTKTAIGASAMGQVITSGKATVLMKAGLGSPVPAAGQVVYLDDFSSFGRGTNVEPNSNLAANISNTIITLGVIKDASNYPINQTVVIDLAVDFNTPSTCVRELLTNPSGIAIAHGAIVHITGDNIILMAQADSSVNSLGTVGVVGDVTGGLSIGPATEGPVVTQGKAYTLMEAGLVGVVAGQTIWLSPNTAGAGTNVKPTTPGQYSVPIGIIVDASYYGSEGAVLGLLNVDPEPVVI